MGLARESEQGWVNTGICRLIVGLPEEKQLTNRCVQQTFFQSALQHRALGTIMWIIMPSISALEPGCLDPTGLGQLFGQHM
eukprot:2753268-Amphidinium_carterae.1